MYRFLLCFLLVHTSSLFAQGPELTTWIQNLTGETGYGGYPSNVQAVDYTATDVYVSCTCIPGYDIGPWAGNPNVPANQNFIFKLTRDPVPNTGTPIATPLGHVGVLRNGVSIFNAKDAQSYNNMNVWHRDALVFEGPSFDDCLGHPAGNGEYHHHVSPDCLYDHLNDEAHSPLIGFAFDGFPIYGAYGYANTDGSGGIARMRTSYQLRTITERTTLPDGTVLQPSEHGPAIDGAYPLGAFVEDYAYVPGSGDLDEHNGRFCVTPDYPQGLYCYFVTLNAQFSPAYPYILGPTYYGTVLPGNTGPQSGHHTIPGNAAVYDPNNPNAIAELPGALSLELYPVPASDVLTVRTEQALLETATILDMQGRTLARHEVGGKHRSVIPVDGLAPGSYLLKADLHNGRSLVRAFAKK